MSEILAELGDVVRKVGSVRLHIRTTIGGYQVNIAIDRSESFTFETRPTIEAAITAALDSQFMRDRTPMRAEEIVI